MGKRIGRPRSDAAHDALLQAALRLVSERGFRAVSVNDISAEAGVGKMTLYRHWPNKAAIVMDALLALIGEETAFPVAENALASLRRQLELQAVFFNGARGTLIRSLVGEAQSDSELAAAFHDRWLKPRRAGVRRTMERAIAEGLLRPHIDIEAAIDLMYGALYYRLLLGSGKLDKSFLEAAYQQFVEGHGAKNAKRAERSVRAKSGKRVRR